MSGIAPHITSCECLGNALNLNNVEIEDIILENHTEKLRIYKVLLQWKSKKDINDQPCTLYSLLHEIREAEKFHGVKCCWESIVEFIEKKVCIS